MSFLQECSCFYSGFQFFLAGKYAAIKMVSSNYLKYFPVCVVCIWYDIFVNCNWVVTRWQ